MVFLEKLWKMSENIDISSLQKQRGFNENNEIKWK